jgi:hypothetical protein
MHRFRLATITLAMVTCLTGAKEPAKKVDCKIFVLKDCPIANEYTPELQRIIKKYSPQGVRFSLIFEDVDGTQKIAEDHAKTYGFHIPVLLDGHAKFAKKFGVNTSPSVVVLSSGVAVYAGRINDLYARIGVRRPAPTKHDLRNVLDAVLSGKPVPEKKTVAVGCRLY